MLNCIVIQGRFTKSPELRYTASNTAVCNVALAVQRNRKDQNGEYPTDFVEVVFWGKLAEHVVRWFNQGDAALVRGRLESRDWQDKQGNKRRSWEVQAESVDFYGSKKETKNPAYISYDARAVQEVGDFVQLPDDVDVPF